MIQEDDVAYLAHRVRWLDAGGHDRNDAQRHCARSRTAEDRIGASDRYPYHHARHHLDQPDFLVTAEEIKSSQPVAVEEFFKGLPGAVPAIGPGTNNGSAGGATIDLRGLGPNRTLVMINGRRLVPFNLNGTVDTNTIPIALLSRVDLLTGGASVAYGADAVAGVVNFNLKKNFTGIDVTTSYGGTTNDHDGKKKRTDLTMGANLDDGRGNVVLSIGKTRPIRTPGRPFVRRHQPELGHRQAERLGHHHPRRVRDPERYAGTTTLAALADRSGHRQAGQPTGAVQHQPAELLRYRTAPKPPRWPTTRSMTIEAYAKCSTPAAK
jgi:outer membrane receptor protein involved in Fe transport